MYKMLIYIFIVTSHVLSLKSGQTVTFRGTGAPVIFSSGIFNLVSRRFYSKFIKNMEKNFTMFYFNKFKPLEQVDINELADAICCEKLGLVCHSSFDIKILESSRIEKAILCDPICIPDIYFDGFVNKEADVSFPVMICKAQYLYDSKIVIPSFQTPILNTNTDMVEKIYENIGHADILDDQWAYIAKKSKLWVSSSSPLIDFENWSYENMMKKDDVEMILRDYRASLVNDITSFLNH